MQNQSWIRAGLLLSLVGLSLQVAAAKSTPAPCELCRKIDSVQIAMKVPSADGRAKAIELLSQSKLSADASVRKQEIKKVLDLAVTLIPQDDSGDSDSYLSGLYGEAPKDFDAQIKALPAKSRKVIQDSLKQTANVDENGNG